jgi:hypothetical protein
MCFWLFAIIVIDMTLAEYEQILNEADPQPTVLTGLPYAAMDFGYEVGAIIGLYRQRTGQCQLATITDIDWTSGTLVIK